MDRRSRSVCLFLAALLLAHLPSSAGEPTGDWPHFLGPTGDGVAPDVEIATEWPADGPTVLWKQEVGTGYSAPSILGNRLVLHHRVGRSELTECFDKTTGERIWKQEDPTRYRDPYGYNNGPRCSPLLTSEHVYTYGAEGRLSCRKLADGELLWQRALNEEFEIPKWFFGIGCSPILEGDLLIVLVGGQPNAAVVAVDKATGKTVWSRGGKETWDGATTWEGEEPYEWTGSEMLVSYSSPVVRTIHGKRHLLALLRQGLLSLDPETGDERFHYWFRSQTYESVNAARPVVVGDSVLLSSTYGAGSALLDITPKGDSYTVRWSDPENLACHWSTPIVVGGYAYGFSGRHENEATLRCIDLKNGDVVWQTRGFDGEITDIKQDLQTGELIDAKTGEPIPWPFYGRGSKVRIGEHFLVLGERGTLALIKVSPDGWTERQRTFAPEMEFPSWTAPVLSGTKLYLRDEDSLVCVELAKPLGE